MVYKYFAKKSNTSDSVKSGIVQNKDLIKEVHKPITRKFEKRKYIHLL